jgi:prophage tail gpP-like protein
MSDTITVPLPPVNVGPGDQSAKDGDASGTTVAAPPVPGGFNSNTGQYFDQITRPPYLNRAVVVVNGAEYFEWESVTVSLAIGENPAYTFRLTVSEQEPWPEAWAFFRIKPTDECTVFLDGYKAIDGITITRQVAYDGASHTVELQGQTRAGLLGQGTVLSQTGEFKDQNLLQIAQKVAKDFGVNVTTAGAVPSDKFPRATVTPGETAYEFIESLARQTGVFLTSNPNGDLVLMVGGTGGSDDVVEGRNILMGREVVSVSLSPAATKSGGQAPGTDDDHGANPTHQRNVDEMQSGDLNWKHMPARVLTEIPAWSQKLVQRRSGLEDSFVDFAKIEATITTLGWRTPSGGGIWVPGQSVHVSAPMLILNQSLFLKKVVFTQDNSSGTRSTLTLVNQPPGRQSTE